MIANAKGRDLSGLWWEDKEPERENKQTVSIWLKSHRTIETRGLLMAVELQLVAEVVVVDCLLLTMKPKQEAEAKEAVQKQKSSQGSHLEAK